MEIVGYCTIHKNATSGVGLELETFIGKDVRVIEFGWDGGVMVVNSSATGIATFDKKDVYRKFECRVVGEVLCPPDMDMMQQIIHSAKVMSRKGGYNQILKNMVIQMSLMKGKLTDDFLFQNP